MDLALINKKKRTFYLVNFAIPLNSKVKVKESKKLEKYLDLARELKKLWSVNMTVTAIIVKALETESWFSEKKKKKKSSQEYKRLNIFLNFLFLNLIS